MGVHRPRAKRVVDALLDNEVDAPPGVLLAFTRKRFWGSPLPRLQSPQYRWWKLFSCLPLKFGSAYTSGLTVHWSEREVIGMTSYGEDGRCASVGYRRGHATHFALSQGEFFTSLWVRRTSNSSLDPDPFLLSVSIFPYE